MKTFESKKRAVITIACFLLVAGTCATVAAAASPTTQKSLLDGAAADRKALAAMVFGGFGWTVMGVVSISGAIDYFQKREMSLLISLGIGWMIFIFLGKYFSR